MSALSDFRKAMQDQFERDLKITFVAGLLSGPVQSQDLGCCWTKSVRELPGRVIEQQIFLGVRVFKQYTSTLDPETPFDPTPLEELLEQLEASIQAHQTDAPGVWFQRLTDFSLLIDAQGVEATMLAHRENPGL